MSRFIPGGGMKSLARRVSGLIYNKFIRLVTGGEISDYLFGFIAVRRSVIDPSGFDAVFYGFGDYCVRLLLGIERNNASIKELPARHGTRRHGKSGNRLWKTFIRYTIETLKLAGRNYGYRNK
jgi:dolichol-phosphate mannosyltransferase